MVTDKTILLQYISGQLQQIEKRNPNYLESKKWQKLKRTERKLYKEVYETEREP